MKGSYILLLILFISCSAVKKNVAAAEEINETKLVAVNPAIIFLNYKAAKGENDDIKVSFLTKIVAEGTLKKSRYSKTKNSEDGLVCVQLTKDLVPLDSVYIENPLLKTVEYAEPSGLLQKKQLELDSAEFFVRMQLNPKTKFITISISGNPTIELSKIEL